MRNVGATATVDARAMTSRLRPSHVPIAAVVAGAALLAGTGATLASTTPPEATPAETTAETTAGTTTGTTAGPAVAGPLGELRLIGEQRLSNLTMVDGTLVGGLSGIDYDAATGQFVVISDDRSDNNPARFYDASLTITSDAAATTFDAVEIVDEHTFLQPDGSTYPNGAESEAGATGAVPDPEGIRIDPADGTLWWSTEGSQQLEFDPAVNHANPFGIELASLPLPEAFGANPEDAALGIRNNKAAEGLTFSADGESLFVVMEGPLYQDGELATVEHGAVNRLVQLDRDGNVLAQYAVEIDPVQGTPSGPDAAFADNGITELLAIDDTTFLVIERSGVPQAEGPWQMHVRLYLVDISGATDVQSIDALAGADYTPASKTLVLDWTTAGLEHVDNLEGISWGPDLGNGNRSIVVVSDNNFDPTSITQFFLYEVVPA